MLDQKTQKSLDTAEDRAVNHDRTFGLIIRTGKLQFKTLWEAEINLDRTKLP